MIAAELRFLFMLFVFLAGAASLWSQTLTGTVTNGTTGKPSPGDSIALITLGQAMKEIAHSKTDAGGHFSFRLSDPGPHLIRALHQGVPYHRLAPFGTSFVALQVFDVSRKVAGIRVNADVMRFQAQGGELQGTRLFALNNASDPPRTQAQGKDFEFFLPDSAVVDQGIAKTAGGQPVVTALVSEKEKNRYGFAFPLRPGETEFQVVFHMGYSGNLSIEPRELYGAEHFVVMVPKTMFFTAAPDVDFQDMEDPRQSDALVRVMSNTRAGQPLDFTISGTGTLSDPGDDSLGVPHAVSDETVAPPARNSSQEKPVAAPGPLGRYELYFLTGILLFLLGVVAVYLKRHRSSPASGPSSPSSLLLDQFKDELFQLEVEHRQGRISQREYESARAALDQTLERAIKRGARK